MAYYCASIFNHLIIFMKLSTILFVMACLCTKASFGQELPYSMGKFSAAGLGWQQETRVGDLSDYNTLALTAVIRYGYIRDSYGDFYMPLPGPKFTIEPRHYINMDRRIETGKRTENYSGFYLGFPITLTHYKYNSGKFTSVELGPGIGFQYSFGKKKRGYFQYSRRIGLGLFLPGKPVFVQSAVYSIGWVLKTKEKL